MAKGITFSYAELEADLASKMKYHAGEIMKTHKAHCTSRREFGDAIAQAHATLAGAGREGFFRPWLINEVKIPRSTAYKHLAYVEGLDAIEAEVSVHNVDTLSLDAVKVLAAPDTPKAVRTRAAKAHNSGQVVTAPLVRSWLPPETEEEDEEEEPEEEETTEEAMARVTSELESYCRSITGVAKEVPDCEWWDEGRTDALRQQLRAAARTVRNIKPAGLCVQCKGDGCKQCKQSGWMPKLILDSQ